MKIKRQAKKIPIKITAAPDRALIQLNEVFTYMNERLVGRGGEIDALRLALLTGHHLMLEGLHGLAKSQFATTFVKCVTGAKFFSTQLTSSTNSDQLFGPMNVKKYQDEAIWEHNTKGSLPEADLAFLDETYRGPTNLLPTILSILNERVFFNGIVAQKCPLMTCIGTTNFVPDDTELDAFHDRWLIRVKVQPLDSPQQRQRMLQSFDNALRKIDDNEDIPQVSLAQIKSIQEYVRNVKLPEEHVKLLCELTKRFTSASKGSIYISDRRLCWVFLVAKAAYAMEELSGAQMELTNVDYIQSAAYVLTHVGDTEQGNIFGTAFSAIVQAFSVNLEEFKKVNELKTYLEELGARIKPNMKSRSKTQVKTELTELLAGFQNGSERPSTPSAAKAYDGLTKKAKSLILEIDPDYDKVANPKPALDEDQDEFDLPEDQLVSLFNDGDTVAP